MPSLPLKPPVRVSAIRPLRSRQRTSLSREIEEAMFRHAEVLSEGDSHTLSSGRVYLGSTMITVELLQLGAVFAGMHSERARRELLDVTEGSVRVRLRATRIARAEVARRVPGADLGTAQVETRVDLRGSQLLIDVDLEVPLSLSSTGSGQ